MPRGGQSAELRRKAGEAARARDRQAAAASQDEADESDATEEEATGGRMTRVGRPRGGMKVAARSGEGLRREMCGGGVPSSHPPLGCLFSFFLLARDWRALARTGTNTCAERIQFTRFPPFFFFPLFV